MWRISTRSLLCDALLLTLWASSAGLVVIHEHGRLWGGGVRPLTSLTPTFDVQEQWFGLYYGNQKVGYANTRMAPQERAGMPGVSMTDQGRVQLALLGLPQRIDLSATAFIDADLRLQEFTATVQTEAYRLKWTGYRQGDDLVLVLTTGESTVTRRLRDPAGNAMVGGFGSWLAFHELSVGQWGEAWLLNPLSLGPETVHFTVRREEAQSGERALVVETDVRGLTTTSWVTRDGRVLKEESPMGWMLIQEPPQVAMAMPTERTTPLDLLSTVAVPIDRPLPDPAALEQLVLLVEGAGPDAPVHDRSWQTVLPVETLAAYGRTAPARAWCVLQLRRAVVPGRPATTPDAVVHYAQPSPFIQSDDPRILAKARDIVGRETDPWRQVSALNRWVYTTLAKRLTVGLPTAVDVLLSPSGDCHEHTLLFTALARSLGIPARPLAGLVYYHDRFYYHAWPEVWVGAWVPTDPTLGQPVADCTHVALVEAENESLIGLAKFVGQLRLAVLEQKGGE